MERRKPAAPATIVNALRGDTAVHAISKIQSDNYKEHALKSRDALQTAQYLGGAVKDSELTSDGAKHKSQSVALNLLSNFINSNLNEGEYGAALKTNDPPVLPNSRDGATVAYNQTAYKGNAQRELGLPSPPALEQIRAYAFDSAVEGKPQVRDGRSLNSAERENYLPALEQNDGNGDGNRVGSARSDYSDAGEYAAGDGEEAPIALKPMPSGTSKKANRKEVVQLRNAMLQALQSIGCEDADHKYSSDVHGFVGLITEENDIFTHVFDEVIRQVTVHMIERGELLNEIRHRYSSMFAKIPKHVQSLYLELVSLRSMNARLVSELQYTRGIVKDAGIQAKELENGEKHLAEVASPVEQDGETKTLPEGNTMEGTAHAEALQDTAGDLSKVKGSKEEITSDDSYEFGRLYKSQRDRLAEELQHTIEEKLLWLDSATALALRLGSDSGRQDIAQLYRCGHSRARAALECAMLLERIDVNQALQIEKKILEWKLLIKQLCQSVAAGDQKVKEIVRNLQRDMLLTCERLDSLPQEDSDTCEPKFAGEAELARTFAVYDMQMAQQNLRDWISLSSRLSARYGIEVEPLLSSQVNQVRELTTAWYEVAVSLVQAHENSVNGSEYTALFRVLQNLVQQIRAWLDAMRSRITGEDGLAKLAIQWQGDIEGLFAQFNSQKLLPAGSGSANPGSSANGGLALPERKKMRDAIYKWVAQSSKILAQVSKGTEKELQTIPFATANFLTRLTDQLSVDSENRSALNRKIQRELVAWQVSVLAKSGGEEPSPQWDSSLQNLSKSMDSLNEAITQDLRALQPLGADLSSSTLIERSKEWKQLSLQFLEAEKESAANRAKLLKDFKP